MEHLPLTVLGTEQAKNVILKMVSQSLFATVQFLQRIHMIKAINKNYFCSLIDKDRYFSRIEVISVF